MKFVSLFAGAGGFDLGLERNGHECVGQCEIEPVALDVLTRHWPTVPKHHDVSTIRHDTFAHPELVTFGSPCQDLSVAGKRAGMVDGETRSGLFYDAVRYIREIQEATDGRLPKLALWENVPGAYSSNNGDDFATVLALLVGGEVRTPPTGWPNAGVAFGPLGSAEWRTLNSRYFGVAQRRRRVFLVYRPGSDRAGEVLLEPNSVRGHPQARREARQDVAGPLEARATAGDFPGTDGAVSGHIVPVGWWSLSRHLSPVLDGTGPLDTGIGTPRSPVVVWPLTTRPYDDNKAQESRLVVAQSVTTGTGRRYDPETETLVPIGFDPQLNAREDRAGALNTGSATGGGQPSRVAVPIAFTCKDSGQDAGPIAPTLRAMGHTDSHANGGGQVAIAYAARGYKTGRYDEADVAEAITTSADRTRAAPVIAFALRGREDGAVPEIHEDGSTTGTVRGTEGGSSRDYVAFDLAQITSKHNRTRAEPGLPNGTLAANSDPHVATGYAVRRLTPRECERLQAFPDDWTRYRADGTELADTHRYRLMGNAVTVNVIEWIGRRLPA